MSEGPQASPKPKGGFLTWALWGAALLGVAAVVYIIAQASTKTAPVTASAPAAPGAAAKPLATKTIFPATPTPAPDFTFYDAAGKPTKIADFKGKVVVLNVWATWCAPCVTEMPTLAKLQAAYAGQPVEVVAVSIDSETAATKARLFMAKNDPLKFYHDRSMSLPFKLTPPAPGAPTTIIYGKDGLERVRVAGEADWAGPEARALVDKALADG